MRDKHDDFLRVIESFISQINVITLICLILVYFILKGGFELENFSTLFVDVSTNMIAVLLGILISQLSFGKARKLEQARAQERLTEEISHRIGEIVAERNEQQDLESQERKFIYRMNDRYYFNSPNNLLRPIPDDKKNTLTYLLNLFEQDINRLPSIPETSTRNFSSSSIPRIGSWLVPTNSLDREEQEQRELWHRIR
ncbi:MAG: hypothetical protein AAFY26_21860, partial [Cyanobacteria bacterium J06638_22]